MLVPFSDDDCNTIFIDAKNVKKLECHANREGGGTMIKTYSRESHYVRENVGLVAERINKALKNK